MSERTIPAYGARIKIEEVKSGFYLREWALDAVQEQVLEDLTAVLDRLAGRSVEVETDYWSVRDLVNDLREAIDFAEVAAEIAFSKRPAEDDEA